MFAELGYVPTTRQAVFHDATEFDVFYGGAAGGGKTKALLLHGIREAMAHPGLRIGAFRRTYDELAESFFKELALIDFARGIGARWNGTERELRFANLAVMRFRYLETIADATRRQGGEYQLVLLDERTLIPPAAVSIVVDERIRSGRSDLPVLGVRSASNPGGIGHGACKLRYIDATDYGAKTYVDDQDRGVRFVPAKVTDNPHVDAGYARRLDAISDPARRAAMRDGSWDSFAGQYFPQWRRERHIVAPFDVPETWTRYAGLDWGYAVAWSVLWAALDEDGRLWVYRQIYEAGVSEKEQARRILAAEGALTDDDGDGEVGLLRRRPAEKIRARLADPSMWAKRAGGAPVTPAPIATTYGAEGCHLLAANNDRINGWQRVHTYLDEGPACPAHRELGWQTCPLLHVFDTCTELIHAIPNAPRDPDRPEDLDSDYDHDHDLDALRYLVGALPVPRTGREAKKTPATPDERFHAYIANQAKKRTRARRR